VVVVVVVVKTTCGSSIVVVLVVVAAIKAVGGSGFVTKQWIFFIRYQAGLMDL